MNHDERVSIRKIFGGMLAFIGGLIGIALSSSTSPYPNGYLIAGLAALGALIGLQVAKHYIRLIDPQDRRKS